MPVRLGTNYIPSDADIVSNKRFVSSISKFQYGKTQSLSVSEKAIVTKLPSTFLQVVKAPNKIYDKGNSLMEERRVKRRKNSNSYRDYVNCDLILGSLTEVGRIWRTASDRQTTFYVSKTF